MAKKKIITRLGIVIEIDPSLDKYNHIELFPEKVAKANEMLRNVGLPEDKNK
jgi:hypothetical protein